MKTKELSKQVRDKVVEKFKSGLVYKRNQKKKETKDNPEGAGKLLSGELHLSIGRL